MSQHKLPATADELAAIEAKLAELGAAEEAFARTHAELAARSDALSEQEAALAARERAVAAKEATPELDALEARIRRLEHGGRKRGPSRRASAPAYARSRSAACAGPTARDRCTNPTVVAVCVAAGMPNSFAHSEPT